MYVSKSRSYLLLMLGGRGEVVNLNIMIHRRDNYPLKTLGSYTRTCRFKLMMIVMKLAIGASIQALPFSY